jgi:hypothetical protein
MRFRIRNTDSNPDPGVEIALFEFEKSYFEYLQKLPFPHFFKSLEFKYLQMISNVQFKDDVRIGHLYVKLITVNICRSLNRS